MKALEYLLNFRTNKATINDTNGQVKTLKENILGIGTSISSVQKSLTKFAHSQKWANITNLTTSVAAGFTNIAGNVKNAFMDVYGFMDKFATEGDKIAKTSRLVGLSAKDYQAFSFAADRSGIKLETMNSALQKFNVNLGKAKSGDKTANKMFAALLPGKVGDYSSSKDILLAMADSYTKLSASQRAFVSQEMFGRSGMQMAELLGGGSAGVSALLNQFEELGGGFGDDAAENAEKFKDELTNMNTVMNSMKVTVAGALLPAFSELFRSITKYFKSNKGDIQKTLKAFGESFVNGIQRLLPKMPAFLGAVVSIVGAVASIVEYLGPVKSIVGVALLGSVGSIVSMVTALIGLLGGPAVATIAGVAAAFIGIKTTVSEIKKNWEMLSTLTLDEFFNAVKMSISELSDAFSNAVGDGFVRGWNSALRKVPLLGRLFGSNLQFDAAGVPDLGSEIGEMMKGTNTTTTSRFSVDFKNVPQGVKVTPPASGDFDYYYGTVLGGF